MSPGPTAAASPIHKDSLSFDDVLPAPIDGVSFLPQHHQQHHQQQLKDSAGPAKPSSLASQTTPHVSTDYTIDHSDQQHTQHSSPSSIASTHTQDSSPTDHPLYHPDVISSPLLTNPPVYGVSASTLAAAIDHHYSTPLPDIDAIFPWSHGIHESNLHQRAFFDFARQQDRDYPQADTPITLEDLDPGLGAVPTVCRGLLLVKVGPKTPEGTLIGTLYPQEILAKSDTDPDAEQDMLSPSTYLPQFLSLDPTTGISLRNFSIQLAKWATVSDICLYVADERHREHMLHFAHLLSTAQHHFHSQHPHLPVYITCIVKEPFTKFLHAAPHVVAVPPKDTLLSDTHDQDLRLKNWDSNFLFHEGIEMSMMSSASIIGPQSDHDGSGGAVWLGNTADLEAHAQLVHDYIDTNNSGPLVDTPEARQARAFLLGRNWTLYVRCAAQNPFPELPALDHQIRDSLCNTPPSKSTTSSDHGWTGTVLNFPASGTLAADTCGTAERYAVLNTCKLLHVHHTASTHRNRPASALVFCNDGYTETSLLALAYLVYATGVSAAQAWVDLHVKYHRPFFAFPGDKAVLAALEPLLHRHSPAIPGSLYHFFPGAVFPDDDTDTDSPLGEGPAPTPEWYEEMDGSLPSRVLPHLYLGSIAHANNAGMLRALGIRRVVSVGETPTWFNGGANTETGGHAAANGEEKDARFKEYRDPYPGIDELLLIPDLKDDGISPLITLFTPCTDFLDRGYTSHQPTLVHCRVGVSRSATVCIAEVMKRLGVGLPRAYLFVRVRRLNVIIQPHLKFMYELAKWEEMHRRRQAGGEGGGWLREVDWGVLCREVGIMNRAYIA